MTHSAIVVGSGPAAAGTVSALLAKGWNVTVLDVGNQLDPATQETVTRMRDLPVEKWHPQDLARVTARNTSEPQVNHSKRSYGSNYVFDDRNNLLDIHWQGFKSFHHSLSFGGLSNIWGSSMLPYRQQDLADWPFPLEDLVPHYREIMNLVPCTGEPGDDIDHILPRYSEQKNTIRLSRQGEGMLRDLRAAAPYLLRRGIRSGKARLAIRAKEGNGPDQCQYCGLCLSGCPHELIYSSAHSFSEWIESGKITYLAEHMVERVEQTDKEAVVLGRNLRADQPFRMQAHRVFLAAGVLPTAKIVLQSRPDLTSSLKLRDSQYFIYPILRFRPAGDVLSERLHTSCQIFMEIEDPNVSDHLVHLQIYGYSSFLREEILRTFLRFPLRWKWLHDWFFSRLMIAQGFIHSNESGFVELTGQPHPDGTLRLLVRPVRSLRTLRTVLMAGIKLLKHATKIGAVPLLPGLQYPRPGAGYHSGGTFPMKAKPGVVETDSLGRLNGWHSIHIVDSSVFPSIPATSIVMTSMANAHRIATLASPPTELGLSCPP